ncbi:4-hydroxybenzoate transporter PcaK [Emticicia aquatica]|uniref:4-hydroxybenzoate transporter PcaK n=1 Tax=Emticicia aquatica TaxID=1681835 RepID=A0ABN8EY54_9BACT|nr:MFS transporter [Emticicia aquatica]CAH0997706.1 4-hydroxybenzoate transporter PcaK [Emticicia aquatica]
MTSKIKTLIDQSPMTRLQYTTIFICILMNMLDGMDVMVISYAAPSIVKSWLISPEKLGIVFSAGLLGMTLGAMFLAPKADIIGRKSMILLSAILMGISIFATAYVQSIELLVIIRIISGLGIGAMLASTATLTSEYTPNKTKDFWVSFVIAGYPIGAVLSGLVAAKVIPQSGWQAVFQIAGIATLITIPLIYFLLSESLDFYLKTQPPNALKKANEILLKMRFPILNNLPEQPIEKTNISVKSLLVGATRLSTIQLWIALFMAFATLYFLTNWIPKLATNAGLSIELAIYAGTVFNMGAFLGIITQGYLSSKFGLKKTIGGFLILTAILMATFGYFSGSDVILLLFGLIGFGIQGGFVGLYAVSARLYPTEIRTTGVGWAIGAGRLGAIIGPLLGGVFIGMGLSMTTNFMIYAIPALIAGIFTIYISSDTIS